jgi:hypothetical protein
MSSFYGAGHERLLQEQLQARALEPVRRHVKVWAERLGTSHAPSVKVEITRPGQAPRVTGSIDALAARATAWLGVSWVLGVWARGLAVIDDALVLELLPTPTALGALAVRWEARPDGSAEPVAVPARLDRRPDRSWSVVWDAP